MKFRNNAAAVIINNRGLILAGKRTDVPNAWQLPQGGIDKNERADKAALREVFEETGIESQFLELAGITEKIKYIFPPEIKNKMGFDGQEQIFFLFRIADSGWSLKRSNEFCDFEWISDKEVVKRAVEFKKSSYVEAFRQLFGVKNDN